MKKVHYTHNYLLAPYHPLTVNVIGAGGTGCQVLTALARINCALQGLGHQGLDVTAYDDDIVTRANLGRQLFTPLEVGANKAEVLITRINRFFGFDWSATPSRYPSEDTHVANITISCVDNVKARVDIGKSLRKAGKNNCDDRRQAYYWLDFGNTTDTGQVVLGTIGAVIQPKSKKAETVSKLPCVDKLFDLSKVDERDSGPSCSLAEALRKQDLFINSTLSQLGCNLLWKLISQGMIDCNGLYLNLKTMKVNPISL
ncbi:MAG: PRTRC system ThiF family protein [Prevotella sp.]|nr:PRTRC system ThiF family protein [Prevotella sp.]